MVVFDSNVWISALHFRGTPQLALEAAITYDRIACCNEIVSEAAKTLRLKFRWKDEVIHEAMDAGLTTAYIVALNGSISGVCRDANDDMVLECALLPEADTIVSGDRDLLVLGKFRGITILSARRYLESRLQPFLQ